MITDHLKVMVANHIETFLIVKGFHWNVTGINFTQFHDVFEEISQIYFGPIDKLAEFIRVISESTEFVNASVDVVKLNNTIKGNIIVGDAAVQMCRELLRINEIHCDNYAELFDTATKENLQDVANYAASQLEALNVLKWKLLAISK